MMKKIDAISKKTEEILSKAYARRLIPDETGGYVASIQEFPGCIAEGDTAEEALQNLDKAATSWVEVALSSGYEIRDPVSFYGCSGKIALRIPRGLHKQVAELAELGETSVNQLLVTAIAHYVGGKHAFRELSETVFSEMQKVMSSGLVFLCQNSPTAISMSFRTTGVPFYSDRTTIEGQIITKTLAWPPSMTKPIQLGELQQ